MKFFHAENANRTLPTKFHLYEYCGTWLGVAATEDETLIEALPKIPAVTEITEETYKKLIRRMVNLPESMRPVVAPLHAISVVGDGVPVMPAVPKVIESTVPLETVLTPVKVETLNQPAKPLNQARRLGKHAVKRSQAALP